MQRVKKYVSSVLAWVLVAGMVAGAVPVPVSAAEKADSYTAEIKAQLLDYDAETDEYETTAMSGVNIGKTEITATADSLTVTMLYTGAVLYDVLEDGVYQDTSEAVTVDGVEYQQYTFAIDSIDDKVEVYTFRNSYLTKYIGFEADEEVLAEINNIYQADSGDDKNDDAADDDIKIPTSVKVTAVADKDGTPAEQNAVTFGATAPVSVNDDGEYVITVTSNGEREITIIEADDFTYTVNGTVYTFVVEDLDVKIGYTYNGGGLTHTRYLMFSEDDGTTIVEEPEEPEAPIIGEDGRIAAGTHWIKTISKNTNGTSDYEGKQDDWATFVVEEGKEDIVNAYLTVADGGTYSQLTFEADGVTSEGSTTADGVITYHLTFTNDEDFIEGLKITVTFGGYQYLLSFDLETIGGDPTDDIPWLFGGDLAADYEFSATGAVTVAQWEDVAKSAATAYTQIDGTGEYEVLEDGTVVLQLTGSGNPATFGDENGKFDSNVVAEEGADRDVSRVYRLVLDKDGAGLNSMIETRIVMGGSELGYKTTFLSFTAGATAGNTNPNVEPESEDNLKTGTAKFTIGVEAQNEDGTVNEARDKFIESDATLEVSQGSLIVYVKASERELYFGEEGSETNDIVDETDGVRRYRFVLNDPSELNERIRTTFPVTGDNPNYGSDTPEFFLAFIVDDETMTKIEDIFVNGIDEDVDYTKDGDDTDGSGDDDTTASGASGSSGSGSSAKTGDTTPIMGTLFTLLAAAGAMLYVIRSRKNKVA